MLRFISLLVLTLSCLHAATVDEVLTKSNQWDNKVFRDKVSARWLDDETFWYRVETAMNEYEYVKVDARSGKKITAAKRQGIGLPGGQIMKTSSNLDQLRASTSGKESKISFTNKTSKSVWVRWVDYKGVRQKSKEIKPNEKYGVKTFAGHIWLVQGGGNVDWAVIEAQEDALDVEINGPSKIFQKESSSVRGSGMGSPDGRWQTKLEKGRLQITNSETKQSWWVDGKLEKSHTFEGPIKWAPDSSCFVLSASDTVSRRRITIVDSSPKDQLQPKKLEMDYVKPGDPLPRPVPVIIAPHKEGYEFKVVESELFQKAFMQRKSHDIRWAADSSEFYLDYNQRGHQDYRILAVNPESALVRTLVQETSPTFIDYTKKTWRHWLDQSGEILWMSERSGWCHLYLYNIKAARLINSVTQGEWVVREVLEVGEEQRQVWFMASGIRAGEDPYHLHLCRVNLDGSGFVQLTQGDGNHSIVWSPNKKYFIDRWSRVDHPPVTELRRSADGGLITVLEKADITALVAAGWQMPERFVIKARDGKTNIHGVIIKPSFFDSQKKYPVVEQIYAGPHGAFAPKEFEPTSRRHKMAEAGFIMVQADGMGTNHRGKKFHDVSWKNLKDAGFPDRIPWIKDAAKTRPWMDLKRVGIYGGSAGGQSSMRALLDHHDFYKVAVADCGCHDNRMDKIWWNEQWMGWPIDDSYARSSNVEDAAKLQGKLLLIVGELDTNVDPATTYQVVNALQKAQKSFEYMPIIGAGHSAAETPYGNRLRLEFLMRHLGGEGD